MVRIARRDGVGIGYEVRGRGAGAAPTLVMVHGLGYSRAAWGPVVDRLAGDLRLVLIDKPGIGDSDVPPGPHTADQMAGDVLAVVDDLGRGHASR